MFKTHFMFLTLPMAAATVFTLCLRRSVGAPVSLSPPPEKALIGQRIALSEALVLRCVVSLWSLTLTATNI